jgi:hypothetical protein
MKPRCGCRCWETKNGDQEVYICGSCQYREDNGGAAAYLDCGETFAADDLVARYCEECLPDNVKTGAVEE